MEKEDLKAAIREVLDEATVAYSQGAARFAESYTNAMAALIDSCDQFYTRNLVEDPSRRATAKAYVDARLAALRRSGEIIDERIRAFQGMRANLTASRNGVRTARRAKGRRR